MNFYTSINETSLPNLDYIVFSSILSQILIILLFSAIAAFWISNSPGNHPLSLLIFLVRNSLNLPKLNQRSLLAADPSQSVMSGPKVTNLEAGTTTRITVSAKDANGSPASGTDKFMVKISGRCTKQNDYYCSPNAGTGPLSANVNGVMTYTSNGEYCIWRCLVPPLNDRHFAKLWGGTRQRLFLFSPNLLKN